MYKGELLQGYDTNFSEFYFFIYLFHIKLYLLDFIKFKEYNRINLSKKKAAFIHKKEQHIFVGLNNALEKYKKDEIY